MKNKEIQEKRMKEYFIQATKEILKGEGIQSISVRNIADKAGYSYATLYNYFKDVNDLIFLCVSDFQEECKMYVTQQTKKNNRGIEKLKQSILAYMGYFTDYPGIFELFYIAKVGDFGNKQNTIDLIAKSLDAVCETEWNYCLQHNLLTVAEIENLKSPIRYLVVGMLLLYLNRRTPASYTEFMQNAANQIDQLFEKNGANASTTIIQNDASKIQNALISVNIA
jgi:AcrR family transcriptional regulator